MTSREPSDPPRSSLPPRRPRSVLTTTGSRSRRRRGRRLSWRRRCTKPTHRIQPRAAIPPRTALHRSGPRLWPRTWTRPSPSGSHRCSGTRAPRLNGSPAPWPRARWLPCWPTRAAARLCSNGSAMLPRPAGSTSWRPRLRRPRGMVTRRSTRWVGTMDSRRPRRRRWRRARRETPRLRLHSVPCSRLSLRRLRTHRGLDRPWLTWPRAA
mmetsp:Transcript_4355/g.18023  ORF Transcript_4355/g.18023 Transcript_4355/m.18023 type:complete len:210 (-) Transcript_4355:395-1024(-)